MPQAFQSAGFKRRPVKGFSFNRFGGEKVNQLKQLQKNIDPKTVTSVVVGMAAFGAIMYAAVRTGIKPLKQAAEVAKGGK